MLTIETIKTIETICYFSSRDWNTGFVSSGVSLTLLEEVVSLVLIGHPASDSVLIPYGADVLLHRPASQTIFSYLVG